MVFHLSRIIVFFVCCISVFHTLGIKNDHACFLVPTIGNTSFANQFFLTHPPEYSGIRLSPRCISENMYGRFSIWESRWGASSTSIRFWAHTALRRMHRTNQSPAALFSFALPQEMALSLQIILWSHRLDMFFSYPHTITGRDFEQVLRSAATGNKERKKLVFVPVCAEKLLLAVSIIDKI